MSFCAIRLTCWFSGSSRSMVGSCFGFSGRVFFFFRGSLTLSSMSPSESKSSNKFLFLAGFFVFVELELVRINLMTFRTFASRFHLRFLWLSFHAWRGTLLDVVKRYVSSEIVDRSRVLGGVERNLLLRVANQAQNFERRFSRLPERD